MAQDTIAFLRDICKKIKEVAELSDHFLALQAAKKKRKDSFPVNEAKAPQNRLMPSFSCIQLREAYQINHLY